MKIVAATDEAALAGLFSGGWDAPEAVRTGVATMLAAVRADGDAAVVAYTRAFDAPEATAADLRVAVPTREAAASLVPPLVVRGLDLARERVGAYHARQLEADARHREDDGTVSAFLHRPLSAIGAYVPGGTATLPSSVVMAVVPARIAGVPRVVVATPPGRDGRLNPAILYACAVCGVDELYAVGGAQAIAALAYGTRTIRPVDKIVGPGNVWVTEAKRQVYGTCGIDGLAGPSEVLVVADAEADATLVAGELVAQAEHDPLARVAAVSVDRGVLERVAALLDGPFATECGRAEIVARVLADRTFLVHAASRAEILDVIDRMAPEHLALICEDAWELVPEIRRAGAIFIGAQTPVAAGDYLAGSNHVLPTSGAGRFSSGLHTADFRRTMSLMANSTERMEADAEVLAAFADFEGLPGHARTARLRAARSRA